MSLKRPFVPKSDVKQWFTTTTNKQLSEKFNNDWKKSWFIGIFRILHNLTLLARQHEKFFIYPAQICYACY